MGASSAYAEARAKIARHVPNRNAWMDCCKYGCGFISNSPVYDFSANGCCSILNYFTNSISPGRQVFSIQGSSGPYIRNATNQPLPGTVASQLFSKPLGGSGEK